MKDLTEEDLPKLILIEDLGTMYPTENSKKENEKEKIKILRIYFYYYLESQPKNLIL